MLVVLDLDNTLVYYGKRISVPRQTFHILRDLHYRGFKIVVISYNPLGELLIAKTGLSKYISFSVCSSKLYRPELFSLVGCDDVTHYFDDRKDNLLAVKEVYPNVIIHHVKSALTLYKDLKF